MYLFMHLYRFFIDFIIMLCRGIRHGVRGSAELRVEWDGDVEQHFFSFNKFFFLTLSRRIIILSLIGNLELTRAWVLRSFYCCVLVVVKNRPQRFAILLVIILGFFNGTTMFSVPSATSYHIFIVMVVTSKSHSDFLY